jgi:flagellar basal-body rod protein FlgC
MNGTGSAGSGVKVSGVTEDPSAFNLVYDPENPDANKDGYVQRDENDSPPDWRDTSFLL